jgi:DNA gyrase subunit A
MVGEDDELLVVNSGGVVIRTSVREISRQGRDATGVRVMNLSGDDVVAAVAPVLAVDDLESDEANGEVEPPDGDGGLPDGNGEAPPDPGSNGNVL